MKKLIFWHFVMWKLQGKKNFFWIANHSKCRHIYCIWLDFAWPHIVEIRDSFRTKRQKRTNKGTDSRKNWISYLDRHRSSTKHSRTFQIRRVVDFLCSFIIIDSSLWSIMHYSISEEVKKVTICKISSSRWISSIK